MSVTTRWMWVMPWAADLRPGEEGGRGGALLVTQRLGAGQAGEPVHGGVKVEVAARRPGVLGALGGAGRLRVAAVHAPSPAVGDAADLLHIQMDHVARPVRDDPARSAVRGAVGVDEAAPAESEGGQVAGDGAPVEHDAALGELGGDTGPADRLCSRRRASIAATASPEAACGE
ncbi:hypothetical protein GCM10023405_16800 [Streptomonospora salina]